MRPRAHSLRQATADDHWSLASIMLVDLVAKTGLVPSKSEARRLIVQSGMEVDGAKQSDATLVNGHLA